MGLASDSINVTVNPNPGMTVFGANNNVFGTPYIGAGLQAGAFFYLQGVEGQTWATTVSAAAPGFAGVISGVVNVVTPGYRLMSVPATIAATGATTVFFVELGAPTANGSDLLSQSSGDLQAVRPGASSRQL